MIPCCACAPPPPTGASHLLDREERRMRHKARAHWGHLLPAQHPSAFDLANARIVAFAGKPAGLMAVESAPGHLCLRNLCLGPQFSAEA